MPTFFVSDVHLRPDHPERDRRFSQWLAQVLPSDRIIIVGDLCDFWMGARRRETPLETCASLRLLSEFRRSGGALEILAGNHDTWLCPYYEQALGARILTEPHEITIGHLRIRLVHGHLLGARKPWKARMEGRAFFEGFGHVPAPIARTLDRVLAWRNERGLFADEERHLRVYRQYAASCSDSTDLVVFGHVHRPVDEAQSPPRLIVLGGWQRRSCYLRIEHDGHAAHVVIDDSPAPPSPHSPHHQPSFVEARTHED